MTCVTTLFPNVRVCHVILSNVPVWLVSPVEPVLLSIPYMVLFPVVCAVSQTVSTSFQ